MGFVLGLLVEGAIFGVALRAILPGEQRWTIGQTVGIGVVGWLVVGFLLRAVFGALFGLVTMFVVLGGALLLLGVLYLFLFSPQRGGARRR